MFDKPTFFSFFQTFSPWIFPPLIFPEGISISFCSFFIRFHMNCQLIIRNLYTFFIKSQLDLLKYTPSCRPILIRLDPRPKSDHDSAVSKRIYKYSFLLILNDRRIVTQFFFYDLFRFAKDPLRKKCRLSNPVSAPVLRLHL